LIVARRAVFLDTSFVIALENKEGVHSMKKWLRRIPIAALLVGLTLGILYECATHVGRGWLYGEAFYRGMPTSAWRGVIQNEMRWSDLRLVDVRDDDLWHTIGSRIGVCFNGPNTAQLLDDDTAGPVLDELSRDCSPRVREFARLLLDASAKDMHGVTELPEGEVPESLAMQPTAVICCRVALRKCRDLSDED
jgi:hypothetical protein